MTSFVLKIIAMITMILDHTGDTFNPVLGSNSLYFNTIGRIAFPLFCFMLVEGYHHTRNLKKYILRLFIAALISEIPFYILVVNFMHAKTFAMNVLFTFIFGLIALWIWDYKTKEEKSATPHSFTIKTLFTWIIKIIIIAILITISILASFDYAEIGIILILVIHLLFRKDKFLFLLAFLVISIFNYRYYLINYTIWGITFIITSTIIPFIFMSLYNGKKGPNTKYGLYVIYPLHLIILELIRYFFIK